jgi:hypothetical protein
MHYEELHRVHSSKYYEDYKTKEDQMGEHVARMIQMKNACRILIGNPEGKTT